jgi:hypothetical protein
MKLLFTLALLVINNFSFSQSKEDVIIKPINIGYLNSLVLELCNQRTNDSSVFKTSSLVTFKCAEYQSSYMSKYSICTHNNDYVHRGVILENMRQRLDRFNEPKVVSGSASEICTFATFNYGKTTYSELANHILNNFYRSKSHMDAILTRYKYGNFSCTEGVWEGQKGVYVTGFFGY